MFIFTSIIIKIDKRRNVIVKDRVEHLFQDTYIHIIKIIIASPAPILNKTYYNNNLSAFTGICALFWYVVYDMLFYNTLEFLFQTLLN